MELKSGMLMTLPIIIIKIVQKLHGQTQSLLVKQSDMKEYWNLRWKVIGFLIWLDGKLQTRK